MPNIFDNYKLIVDFWSEKKLSKEKTTKSKISVDIPPDPNFGDMSTNAALILSKKLQTPVNEIAQELGEYLSSLEEIEKFEISKHGFLNWWFKKSYLADIGNKFLKDVDWYRNDSGAGKTALVEYVSANPTGPIHIGHVRSAVLGDIIANLLEMNRYKVIREYYINDYGNQIDNLIKSVYQRYRQALGLTWELPKDGYNGAYLFDFCLELIEKYDETLLNLPFKEFKEKIKKQLIDWMINWIQEDLIAIGIVHDTFTSEEGLKQAGLVDAGLGCLSLNNLVYLGKSDPDNPAKAPLIFRSTYFGDDKDRVVLRTDGSHTYFGGDIGYLLQKQIRKIDRCIQLLGRDHEGYKKRLLGAADVIFKKKSIQEVVLYEMVNLIEDGAVIQMSKRAGNMVTLRELLSKVDRDSIRFFMAWHNSEEIIDFDIKKVVEQNSNNPLWYIQYAHARINSIFDKMKEKNVVSNGKINGEFLNNDSTRILMLVLNWSRIVEKASNELDPHIIALNLYNIAKEFHHWYQSEKFIQEDSEQLEHNLALLKIIQKVLVNGLKLLGIKPLKKM